MTLTNSRRLFAIGVALAIATVIGAFSFQAAAQSYNGGAEVFVLSSEGLAPCARSGGQAPVVFQTKEFGIAPRQFWDNEAIYLSLVFPDGRIFSALSAGGLDGLVDMPPNFPWEAVTSNGGDYYTTLTASAAWPYGCYEVTAWGASSNRLGKGYFVLRALPMGQSNPGRASLRVEDNTTGDPSGLHNSTANIFGRGFRANEIVDVWITFPDGSVLGYPSQFTSDVGSFSTSFHFDPLFPTGTYHFTARGRDSGYQVIASFNLASQSSTPNGWAQLVVLWRHKSGITATQDEQFEIAGQFFEPYEAVSVWATLPDNSVRPLPLQVTNEFGEFFALVQLDGRLPTGTYKFTAEGQRSGRLVISNDVLLVTPGDPVISELVPIVDPPPPVVVDNNSDLIGTQGGVVYPGTPIYDSPAVEFVPDAQFPEDARGPQAPDF